MILEIIYFLALAAVGLGLVGRGVEQTGIVMAAGVALPVGVTCMALVQLILAIVGLKLNAVTLWLLVALLAAGSAAWLFIGRPHLKKVALAGAIAGATVVAVAALQVWLHASVISFDSYDYLVLASNLYRPETELKSPAISGFLNNYPPLMWVAHGPSRMFGSEFLVLFHPIVFAATLLTCAGLVLTCLREAALGPWTKWTAAIAPVLVLCTTPQVIHHAVYVMPNLLTGLLLTAAVALLWTASERNKPILLVPAAICLAGVTLARQEGGLMAAVVIVVFATSDNVSWKSKTALAVFVAVIATGWYATVIALTGEAGAGAILTPTNAILQVGCLWLGVAAAAMTAWKPLSSLVSLGAASMPVVLILAHLPYLVFGPAHALESIGLFVTNMLWQGSLWGVWWTVALPFTALLMAVPDRILFGRLMGLVTLTIFLLIDFLGVLRPAPYRLGDQDSGNRMLIHIFPLLWSYFAMRFAAGIEYSRSRADVSTA